MHKKSFRGMGKYIFGALLVAVALTSLPVDCKRKNKSSKSNEMSKMHVKHHAKAFKARSVKRDLSKRYLEDYAPGQLLVPGILPSAVHQNNTGLSEAQRTEPNETMKRIHEGGENGSIDVPSAANLTMGGNSETPKDAQQEKTVAGLGAANKQADEPFEETPTNILKGIVPENSTDSKAGASDGSGGKVADDAAKDKGAEVLAGGKLPKVSLVEERSVDDAGKRDFNAVKESKDETTKENVDEKVKENIDNLVNDENMNGLSDVAGKKDENKNNTLLERDVKTETEDDSPPAVFYVPKEVADVIGAAGKTDSSAGANISTPVAEKPVGNETREAESPPNRLSELENPANASQAADGTSFQISLTMRVNEKEETPPVRKTSLEEVQEGAVGNGTGVDGKEAQESPAPAVNIFSLVRGVNETLSA